MKNWYGLPTIGWYGPGLLAGAFLWLSATLSRAQQPRLVLPIGHLEPLTSVAFSADSKRVATASDDGTAKLWDAQTGALLADLKGHTFAVKSVVFSPDGKRLLTASLDASARLWDAQTGKPLATLKGADGRLWGAEFSPDGKRVLTATERGKTRLWDTQTGAVALELPGDVAAFSPDGERLVTATAGEEGVAKVWNARTGAQLASLKEHKEVITAVAFSPDARQVATVSSRDELVCLWNAETGTLLAKLVGHSAAFSPDGSQLVTACYEGTAGLWDARTGALRLVLEGHTARVVAAVFSPDGKKIVTTSWDRTARLWDARTGARLAELQGHTAATGAAAFSPDSKRVVTASDDRTAKVWDTQTGALVADLKGLARKSSYTAFSPDGKKLLSMAGREAKVWNMQTGGLLADLKGHADYVSSVAFSADGKSLATASGDKTAKVWDTQTGTLRSTLQGHTDGVASAAFSPDGKRVLTASSDKTARLWDTQTGAELPVGFSNVLSATFSPDGRQVLTACWDATARLWDAQTGELLATLAGHKNNIRTVRPTNFSPDGKRLVTASYDYTAKLWDARTGTLLADLTAHGFVLESAVFSPNGQRLATASRDGTAKLWDARTGALLADLHGHTLGLNSVEFSADGKRVVTASDDRTAKVWDTQTGALVADLKGHTEYVLSATFSPDGKRVATTSDDNTIRMWDARTGTLLYTFFALTGPDYFVQIPTGYYLATQNAARLLHYVTKELKVISFEQLDVRYNRPDKVLRAMDHPDNALIRSYRKAYEKRIRKLGIDTSAFTTGYSVPEADVRNRDKLALEQAQPKLTLRITGKDNTYMLDHFNVWVNEVPVFGMKGISLRAKRRHTLDTTLTVTLSQGDNRIEASVANSNGLESYRMPLQVRYSPAEATPEKLYFIGIGINEFSQAGHKLQWSVKDIRDQALAFKKQHGNTSVIDTLFDTQVTAANVKALRKKLLATTVNDKVLVAYSGHGLLSKRYDYYLSAYPVNFSNPQQGGIAYDDLESLLDNIPARKKLLLIDACHSGEVDKEELLKLRAAQPRLTATAVRAIAGSRGAVDAGAPADPARLGMRNSFELMQTLFVNVGRSTGATIISAAGGQQFALEKNDLRNGVFSYSILEYLGAHSRITVSELKEYVSKRVPELTAGLQVPTTRSALNAVDWTL